MTHRPFSLYVHVPFCSQKCPYCDFNTYAVARVPDEEYTEALLRELESWACDPRFSGRSIGTIFFGGGTPSLLKPASLQKVVDRVRNLFGVLSGAEITLEANPSTPSRKLYEEFAAAGINRVSFGVQSFDPDRLLLLGRDHSREDAIQAVELASQAGIADVSVDLIFGVSGQTIEGLQRDIDTACALPISHLSTYALTIEPGTPFFQRQERGLLAAPPDDLVAEMLQFIPQRVAGYGLSRYEISNYSKPGRHSRHNEVYWTGGDYLGIGAGAHSYVARFEGKRLVSGDRWSTLAQPQAYIDGTKDAKMISWRESLAPQALQFEFFYLGLRLMAGVSLQEFHDKFGGEAQERFSKIISELTSEGYVRVDGDVVTLTTDGIALADSVYERFIS